MKILVTGGCGFVGSSLSQRFLQDGHSVTVLDNLKRRGSELNIPNLKALGGHFVHGDIRQSSDFYEIKDEFDLLIEASAEPSVHAGVNGSPRYLIDTNLNGTLNCLEFARQQVAQTIFLSTSRVYSIPPLRDLKLTETETRFELDNNQDIAGLSPLGITEKFPTNEFRSLYGFTKLASEMLIQEYRTTYGLKVLINRCGVIAGPGQFGKVDQGVFTLWVAKHFFKGKLNYTGFGGKGKQVRDLLHPNDLYQLLNKQIQSDPSLWQATYNVGGGLNGSTSLLELTKICEDIVGQSIEIGSVQETASVDIPYYVSDNSLISQSFNWEPQIKVPEIVEDIYCWINKNSQQLKILFQ